MTEINRKRFVPISEDPVSETPPTTVKQDIESFRNIMLVLRKYVVVGNEHPSVTWPQYADDCSDDENYNKDCYPQPVLCRILCVEDDQCTLKRSDLIPNMDEVSLFFHLAEKKALDSHENPKFQSMKFWAGCNDFCYPEFEYDYDLKVWKAESFGGHWFFEFLQPFVYVDNPERPERKDLADQTVENLGSHLLVHNLDCFK